MIQGSLSLRQLDKIEYTRNFSLSSKYSVVRILIKAKTWFLIEFRVSLVPDSDSSRKCPR